MNNRLTDITQRNWDCTGCGAKFDNFGSLGNHGRFSKVCTPAMRFWGKVNKGPHPKGCWLYTGFIKWDGYGWMQHKRKFMTASRFAWIITNGEIAEGQHVMHKCDNPPCCNPDHLRLGTHEENMADMAAKGRCNSGQIKKHKPVLYPDRIRPRRQA